MKLPASTRDAIAIGMLAIGLLVAVILVAWAPVAWAEDAATVRLSLKDHRFQVQIRPLAAGRYRFFDDYHEDTTEGFLNVQ